MGRKIQNWAFVAPKMSRDLSEYYAGILDRIKVRPEIFLHAYTFDDGDLSQLANMDGIISYTVPPKEIRRIFKTAGKRRPPTVAITMCKPDDTSIACAHIDPYGVSQRVFALLSQRHCRSYAFCANHANFFADESAALLSAFRQTVYAHTGKMPTLFQPISTRNPNLIPKEVERFTAWAAEQVTPCGIFVHSDDVARKMLDACRLKGISVPEKFRVVGTGNSALHCERTYPTLSSYAIDHERAGYDAATALLHMIDDGWSPKRASFELPLTDVVERASSVDERGAARFTQDACTFIRAELDRGIAPTVRNVAYHLNISRRKLEKDFVDVLGRTVHDEIAACRMDKLCKLLKSANEPIGVLALRAGFGTVTQANRAFRQHTGMTMSKFRNSK